MTKSQEQTLLQTHVSLGPFQQKRPDRKRNTSENLCTFCTSVPYDVEDLILVVEIKDDDDNSEETRAKGFCGDEHIHSLNRMIREMNPIDLDEPFRDSVSQQYLFYLLRPADYPAWFSRLRNGFLIFDLANGVKEG